MLCCLVGRLGALVRDASSDANYRVPQRGIPVHATTLAKYNREVSHVYDSIDLLQWNIYIL